MKRSALKYEREASPESSYLRTKILTKAMPKIHLALWINLALEVTWIKPLDHAGGLTVFRFASDSSVSLVWVWQWRLASSDAQT
jgi:hypothetical protein